MAMHGGRLLRVLWHGSGWRVERAACTEELHVQRIVIVRYGIEVKMKVKMKVKVNFGILKGYAVRGIQAPGPRHRPSTIERRFFLRLRRSSFVEPKCENKKIK